MSFGLVEIITLLLGMSGFSLQHNPKAPTADASLQYAMHDADVIVQFDAASVIPGNYRVLTRLANQPQIRSSPELAKVVRKAITEIEGARGLAKTFTGIDFTTDVDDATMFLQIPAQGEPAFVVSVRGKFSTANLDKMAKMSRKQTTRIGAGAILEIEAGSPAVAVTKDGVLLAGTPGLLRDRLAATWRAPVRPANSTLAYAAEMINARPVFAMQLALSKPARQRALRELGPKKNFLSDVIQRHKVASLAVYHDGIGWTWVDRRRAGLDAMAQMSEGVMDILRAAQIAPRGFAKIMMGALESYRGTDRRIDQLIRRKADLWKIVDSYTGDGNFQVRIEKDPAMLRLDARATGKSVSEVLPAGLFIPGAVMGLLLGSQDMSASPPAIAVPPPPRARPRPAPRPAPRRP